MAVFYLAEHGVLQELPHTFPAGAFCGVPTIFPHVCILDSEGSYFWCGTIAYLPKAPVQR